MNRFRRRMSVAPRLVAIVTALGLVAVFDLPRDANAAFQLLGGTGVNFDDRDLEFSLVNVDLIDGKLERVGPPNQIALYVGLDHDPAHQTLWGADEELFRIDPVTAARTLIGPLTYNGGAPILMASMTVSPTGELYAVSNSGSTLYKVDPNSGDLTYITTYTSPLFVRAIEFASDGTLYGGYASLYQLDLVTGNVLHDFGRFAPLHPIYISEFDISNGVFRALRYQPDNTATLFEIDVNAPPGQLAKNGMHINDNLFSIAGVPEPSTLVMALVAAATLGMAARRRRRA
ncbi:MAG: PEP-CTERM sorting domain-containing protein [Pirellulales bacterium]|nr:PEP-CTERM sorting domain-containing protein [Pirellulales bacterium]